MVARELTASRAHMKAWWSKVTRSELRRAVKEAITVEREEAREDGKARYWSSSSITLLEVSAFQPMAAIRCRCTVCRESRLSVSKTGFRRPTSGRKLCVESSSRNTKSEMCGCFLHTCGRKMNHTSEACACSMYQPLFSSDASSEFSAASAASA